MRRQLRSRAVAVCCCRSDGPRLEAAINAAISENGLPGHIGSALRSQPDDHVRDLLRTPEPLDGCFCRPAVADLLRRAARSQGAYLGQLLQSLGGGVTGSYVVHED